MSARVLVGMSGGVDSSVAAVLRDAGNDAALAAVPAAVERLRAKASP